MHLDVEDVLAGAVGSVIGRSLLFAAAVWAGTSIGASAIVMVSAVEARAWQSEFVFWLWASPMLLVSYWGILNLAFLLISLVYFIWTDRPGYLAWGVVLGVESLTVMAGWAHVLVSDRLGVLSAWLVWLVLLMMAETGIWLIRQIFIHRWARQMAMARAAMARRVADEASKDDSDSVDNEG